MAEAEAKARTTEDNVAAMVCRVCLQEPDESIPIFNSDRQENMADILEKHLWFKPTPTDSISTVICVTCWTKIHEFHVFYMTVKQSHQELSSLYAPESMMIKFKIKEEIDDMEHENPLYEPEVMHDLMDERSHNEKIEQPTQTEHRSCLEQVTESPEHFGLNENNIDIKSPPPEKKRVRKKRTKRPTSPPAPPDSDATEQQGSCDSETPSKSTRRRDENSKLTVEPSIDILLKPKRKKRSMITEYDDDIIKKHITMGCDLCTFVGENFADMSQHFSKQHIPLRPYVKCCGRKLTKRFLLIQHAYKHEDPEFFKCSDCKKVFSDGYILRAHVAAHHAPEKELTFKCDQCPKSFSRRHLLELHKPAHIPINERKYFCERCPQAKPFASEHLLQIHTHMRHTKATNVCHVCAKEIRDNQAFKKHVRLHFEDSGPRVKCPKPDCDRWLKDMDNLKQHLRRHNDEGKVFACEECGKKCKNRRSLTSHLRYAHTDQVFTCDECQKTFKKAITLKEHMAQHTGETLYKCPFCTRTFNSNANMHSHKKKMHPVEWDIWRKTKSGSAQQIISRTSLIDTVTKSETSTNASNTFNDFLITTTNLMQ